MPGRQRMMFPILVLLAGCVSTSGTVPQGWRTVPEARVIHGIAFDPAGRAVVAGAADSRRDDGPIHVVRDAAGARLANGLKLLTDPFVDIDSLSYSESRGEVVFSARRSDNFDIGLVSSDGSPVNWAPEDPADEVAVQWAPEGNKISYIIRAPGGDVVRTLHIPTSFQYAVPFANATIHALEWQRTADEYAVAYSTPDASDRIEMLEYSGKRRRMVVPPAAQLEVDVVPVASGTVALQPRDVAYGEKLPLVVWVADDFAWSDARAALMHDARVAMVITTREPGEDLWKSVAAMPWIDPSQPFVVSSAAVPLSEGVVITADPALAEGRYRREGRNVMVAPAVVQSFAARFIADQLKRTTPPNVRSR